MSIVSDNSWLVGNFYPVIDCRAAAEIYYSTTNMFPVQEVTLVRIIFASPAISSIPDESDLKSWSIHRVGKTVHYPSMKTEDYAIFHGGEKRSLQVFLLTSYFE